MPRAKTGEKAPKLRAITDLIQTHRLKREDIESGVEKKLPQEFYCPITQEVMFDPVAASDGHIYEREAIEEWLQKNDTSPLTRAPMNNTLFPSYALKSMIEREVTANVFSVENVFVPNYIRSKMEKLPHYDKKEVSDIMRTILGFHPTTMWFVCNSDNNYLLRLVIEHLEKRQKGITLRLLLHKWSDKISMYALGPDTIYDILQACQCNEEWLLELIKERPPPTKFYETLTSALHQACALGNMDLVQLCTRAGAKVSGIKSKDAVYAPLVAAAHGEHEEIVKFLLSVGAGVNQQDEDGYTPTHKACEISDINCLQLLVDNGASLEIQSNSGETPLFLAEDEDIVKYLVRCGVNVNARAIDGKTALHNGDLGLAEILLVAGADPNVADERGHTPLHLCHSMGLAKLLLSYKANIDAQDRKKRTPLHMCTDSQSTGLVETLLVCGADTDLQDDQGYTALHYAAKKNGLKVIELLIQYGADHELQTHDGKLALDLLDVKNADFMRKCINQRRIQVHKIIKKQERAISDIQQQVQHLQQIIQRQQEAITKLQEDSIKNKKKKKRTAYMFYCHDKREEIKKKNPDMKVTEVLSKLAEQWRELSAAEKKPYEALAEKDRT